MGHAYSYWLAYFVGWSLLFIWSLCIEIKFALFVYCIQLSMICDIIRELDGLDALFLFGALVLWALYRLLSGY